MFLTPALFKGQLYLYHISNSAGFSQALLLGATAYSSVSFRYFLVGISKEKKIFSHNQNTVVTFNKFNKTSQNESSFHNIFITAV